MVVTTAISWIPSSVVTALLVVLINLPFMENFVFIAAGNMGESLLRVHVSCVFLFLVVVHGTLVVFFWLFIFLIFSYCACVFDPCFVFVFVWWYPSVVSCNKKKSTKSIAHRYGSSNQRQKKRKRVSHTDVFLCFLLCTRGFPLVMTTN